MKKTTNSASKKDEVPKKKLEDKKESKKVKKSLLDSYDEDADFLKINESYAKNYNAMQKNIEKTKEENKRARLIANLSDEGDSSSSEEEDEDGMLLTPALDLAIHETLNKIKRKDPSIYEKDANFYKEEIRETKTKKTKPSKTDKKISVKDYLVNQAVDIVKGDGAIEGDNEVVKPTKAQESKMLKEQFIEAALDDETDNDGQDFFLRKKKSSNELEAEETEYKEFLKEEESRTRKKKLAGLLEGKGPDGTEGLTKEEKYLREYLANEWWREKDMSKLPSYEDIMGEEEPDQPEVEEDEKEIMKAEDFEHKYNFRFEEKGSSELISYPRNIEDSVRVKKSKRKRQRESKKERREKEMEERAQEIRKLKRQKRKEISERLNTIREIAGDSSLDLDLDGDFDPDAYDKLMQKAFDEEYYSKGDEKLGEEPDEKVVEEHATEFEKSLYLLVGSVCKAYYKPDDDFFEAVITKKLPKNRYRVKFKGYDGTYDLNASEVKVVRKVQTSFSRGSKCEAKYSDGKWYKAKVLETGDNELKIEYNGYKEVASVPKSHVRPVGAKTGESIDETKKILEELYSLDYQDVIGGDIPCRFGYRKVEPADFGMTVQEILELPDKVLRQRVSMKHLAPYKKVKNLSW
eukprot:CAMPEP_0167752216 /NCGR_PEP_ID=MMETSP0110_2-20121227/7011_1 /TAXON_ID=629695 /ORGANISM="Gymnochlora sp., Strain CCMP2014" /LENGTH=632 /DNA_ID=CAMNT_0007637799 /DNA_START=93 /DNA_END=1988 /DNA_ORIENTATION=+